MKNLLFFTMARAKNQLGKSQTLNDYSQFVEITRRYEKLYPYETAINLAIDESIHIGILADFLKKHRNEVVNMSIFEYNSKLHEDTIKEDSRVSGEYFLLNTRRY